MGRPYREVTRHGRRQVLLSPDVDAMLMVLIEISGRTITAEISTLITEEYHRHFADIEDEEIDL